MKIIRIICARSVYRHFPPFQSLDVVVAYVCNIVANLLKARTVEPEIQPSRNREIVTIRDVTRTAVAIERLGKHVSAETNRRTVFLMRSVPRDYKKDNELCFKLVEFRDTSLPGYELASRGIEASELLSAVQWW
jgi:hypothetical protein